MKINSKTKQLNKKKRNESRETRTETMGVRSGSVRESRKGGGGVGCLQVYDLGLELPLVCFSRGA